MNLRKFLLLNCTLSLFFPVLSQAIVKCSIGKTLSHTVSIKPRILSIGPDMPLGSIIYRGNIGRGVNDLSGYIVCSSTSELNPYEETFSYTTSYNISNAPYPLSSWNGFPYAGKVYETGIPGVGIVITTSADEPVTTTAPVQVNLTLTINKAHNIGVNAVDFMLIKIGDISAGDFNINAVQFPTISVRRFGDESGNVQAFNFPVVSYNFSGILRFTQPTCITPDIDVDLGSHEIATFATKGFTPWQSFTIKLMGCPRFNGYYNKSTFPVLFNPSGSTSEPDTVSNSFGLRLTPVSSIINDSNGIMAVMPTDNSASGVGIQIAYDTGSIPDMFKFSEEKVFMLSKNGIATISVPMLARYIKTGSMVSPGKADGKLTFTINYY